MTGGKLKLDLRKTPPTHIADLIERQNAALERRHHPRPVNGPRLRDLIARCRHRGCLRTIPGLGLTNADWGYTPTKTLRCPRHATRQEKAHLARYLTHPYTGSPDHRMWDVIAVEIAAAQRYD